MNYQEKVREFQIASGQPVSDTPRELTKEEYDFRDNLLREEIRELQYAIVDNNRVEILDALCDIKYVNDGTANQMGRENEEVEDIFWHNKIFTKTVNKLVESLIDIKCDEVETINALVGIIASSIGLTLENFKTALDRVHDSNMSKFCYDIKTAQSTRDFYSRQGIDTYIEPREKKFVVYRSGDGKVLKSTDFYPPYLEDLV
ncbi:MAG TPA: hypothetical protein VNR38_00990 [Ureibacillus sp.]|nr:hypothetical protein [Ureibacillus sp.]